MANDVILDSNFKNPLKRKAMRDPAEMLRSRELYRYYQPPRTAAPSSKVKTSEDPSLTAYAQLTALRLQKHRAMISLIDYDTQWIIGESTRTVEPYDNSVCTPGDELWLGGSNVILPSKDGICVTTVDLQPPKLSRTSTAKGRAGAVLPPPQDHGKGVQQDDLPINEIEDLSSHPKFLDSAFVTGSPSLRHYAGCPLRTKKGYYIGSLCVVDTKPGRLSEPDKKFLRWMSDTVMDHLQTVAEKQVLHKVQRMQTSLSVFADTSTFDRKRTLRKSTDLRKRKSKRMSESPFSEITTSAQKGIGDGGNRNSSMSSNSSSVLSKDSAYSQTSLESNSASTPTIRVNPLETEPQTPEAAFQGVFSRACRLIRDALQIEGVVIIDAGDGYLDDSEESQSLRSLSLDVQHEESHENEIFQIGPLGNLFLDELFAHYPEGKIFSYDGDGTISSGDDEGSSRATLSPPGSDASSSVDEENPNLKKRPEYVRETLSAFLPNSTSCIFVPLYESANIPYASCFVWTTQTKKVFLKEEIGYLKTFSRLIMSEVVRLDTLSADRAKGAFISNISHELRSPLHGILASAELLDDTRLDTLQRDFLTAIESCGRTLLDTLNHVLDFSKLNRLQNDRRITQASPLSASDKVDTQVVQDVDLAAVTEEVVEGVFAGFDFRGINSHIVLENSSTTDIIPLQPDAIGSPNGESSRRASAKGTNPKRDVEVIIDIDPLDDWHFRTEVGGFRRVVMNLVGNALKYTDRGYVRVKLEAEPFYEDEAGKSTQEPKRKVVLTVSDSGRGISRDFLKTKLYVPFSQENAMSSGTGLGMSIVRQILDILGGTIDVKSKLGFGTEVVVTLLLHRSTFTNPTPSPGNREEGLELIPRARAAASKKSIAFLGFSDAIPALSYMKRSLIKCSQDWYGMNVIEEDNAQSLMEFAGKADVLLANEISPLLSQLGVKGHKPPVIILCSNAARVDMANLTLADKGGIIDFASKPCGPKKLAKALLFCLTKTHSSRRSSHSSNSSGRTGIYRSWGSFSRPMGDREKNFISSIEDDGHASTSATGAVRISPPVRSGSSSSEPVVYVAGVGHIALAAGSSAVPMSSSPGRQKSIPFLEDFHTLRLKAQAQTQASMQSISGIMHRDNGALIGEGIEIDRPPFASPVIEKDNPLRPKSWAQWQSLDASADDNASPNASPPAKITSVRPDDIVEELRLLSGTPSILLVDDNPLTMNLMTAFIAKKGFLFSEASNGLQALETFRGRGGGYDIVLMDLQLPVMSGLDAVKAIRDLERTENRLKRAFIIALTGSSNEAEALAAGCNKFFTKPIRLLDLSNLITEYQHTHLSHLLQD
ncbi:hypothetical protein TWF225_005629 [Orbilia oligospora]|uniref:histidine kinase n=1 Tax=Orbilia oligospora TaxID=2813651 RepID=A0A7C8P7C2_ORBOL|nr:hypothetical protein TWF751_009521 [Orbilia oligospora]KAF3185142.1 hypothetical protein TWF225_005629 [Orbilia oligospora]KAF3236616.1 hypothetical protein TWF128_001343 [Orbilia oligospora]KAF3253800.1 hypothetical protein TWF217_007276 [Orbilia oligospora]KAF3294015.1 hypothetical protein TWF132_003894 [Orbilia oligospora]